MRAKSILTSLLLTIFLFSCKNEKPESNTTEVDKKEDTFKVTMDLLIKKNDTLHLYYTEDKSINFNEESSIWLPIPGKDINQEITFELPKDVYPTQFRIDFGVNTENEEIVLNKISFNYKNSSFVASDANIFNYFRADENVTILDNAKRSLKRKNPKERRGASLYPHETILGPEIEKMAK